MILINFFACNKSYPPLTDCSDTCSSGGSDESTKNAISDFDPKSLEDIIKRSAKDMVSLNLIPLNFNVPFTYILTCYQHSTHNLNDACTYQTIST